MLLLWAPPAQAKTTLCSLIPRFYDVTEGAIYLDGKDIRKIKLKDLRNQIGIVQQDVYLFAGNIMENIRYGRPDATDEEVIRAAKLANAHDFIMEMPDNYGNGYRPAGREAFWRTEAAPFHCQSISEKSAHPDLR